MSVLSGSVDKRIVVHVPRRFTSRAWGGTERVLEQTLPLLEEQGFTSRIFTSQALDERRVGQVSGFPISRFPYLYPEWPLSSARKERYDNKGGNLLSLDLMKALGEVDGLDLVHLHTGNLLGAQCLKVARRRGVPILITLHGGHFAIPPDELKNLSVSEESDPRTGFRWGRAVSLALGTRTLLRQVDAVVCVGIDEYEAAQKNLPDQRVVFLPGGVDMETFEKAEPARGRELLGLTGERPLIVCVARIDKQKDQATLVRAWAKHSKVPSDLVLVGPETAPGYSEELRRLGQDGPGRFVLHGALDPSLVAHVYAAATVSVLPSRHEPFGLSCLESWAAKAALVAADVGGPGWLLSGQREGKLFPVGDAEALASVLDQLLTSPGQREKLVEAAFQRVREEFTWHRRAACLSELYQELIEARSARKGAARSAF